MPASEQSVITIRLRMKNVIAAAIKYFHAIKVHNNIKLLYRFINVKAYKVVVASGALAG